MKLQAAGQPYLRYGYVQSTSCKVPPDSSRIYYRVSCPLPPNLSQYANFFRSRLSHRKVPTYFPRRPSRTRASRTGRIYNIDLTCCTGSSKRATAKAGPPLPPFESIANVFVVAPSCSPLHVSRCIVVSACRCGSACLSVWCVSACMRRAGNSRNHPSTFSPFPAPPLSRSTSSSWRETLPPPLSYPRCRSPFPHCSTSHCPFPVISKFSCANQANQTPL